MLREELNMTIIQPINNPEQFRALGLSVSAGVLLFGPPGCGKTLIAKVTTAQRHSCITHNTLSSPPEEERVTH